MSSNLRVRHYWPGYVQILLHVFINRLDPDIDNAFWDFDLETLSIGDLTATLDYILNLTDSTSGSEDGEAAGSQGILIEKVESSELMCSSAQKLEMISMGRLFLLLIWSSHANHFHLGQWLAWEDQI